MGWYQLCEEAAYTWDRLIEATDKSYLSYGMGPLHLPKKATSNINWALPIKAAYNIEWALPKKAANIWDGSTMVT